MSIEQQGQDLDALEGLDWWASVNNDNQEQTLFLYRKEAGNNSLLDKYTVSPEYVPTFEDFQIMVKEAHGGGIYEAVLKTAKGLFLKRLPFVVSGLPKRQSEAKEQPEQAKQGDSLEKMLALMMQQNQQMQQNFLAGLQGISQAIAQQPDKKEYDPFEMMERAATILNRNGATPPPPKSLIEQASELIQLRELFGGGSGGDSADGWGSITAALAPLAEMMRETAINDRLKLEIESKRQTAQQAANANKAKQAPNQIVKYKELLQGLKPVLSQVIPFAEQGADVLEVASGIFGIVPKDSHDLLKQFLQRQDAISILAQLEPKIRQHWDWFAELAGHLLELIDNEANDDSQADTTSTAPSQATDSTGATGDTPNPATDGKASATRPRKRPSKATGPTVS